MDSTYTAAAAGAAYTAAAAVPDGYYAVSAEEAISFDTVPNPAVNPADVSPEAYFYQELHAQLAQTHQAQEADAAAQAAAQAAGVQAGTAAEPLSPGATVRVVGHLNSNPSDPRAATSVPVHHQEVTAHQAVAHQAAAHQAVAQQQAAQQQQAEKLALQQQSEHHASLATYYAAAAASQETRLPHFHGSAYVAATHGVTAPPAPIQGPHDPTHAVGAAHGAAPLTAHGAVGAQPPVTGHQYARSASLPTIGTTGSTAKASSSVTSQQEHTSWAVDSKRHLADAKRPADASSKQNALKSTHAGKAVGKTGTAHTGPNSNSQGAGNYGHQNSGHQTSGQTHQTHQQATGTSRFQHSGSSSLSRTNSYNSNKSTHSYGSSPGSSYTNGHTNHNAGQFQKDSSRYGTSSSPSGKDYKDKTGQSFHCPPQKGAPPTDAASQAKYASLPLIYTIPDPLHFPEIKQPFINPFPDEEEKGINRDHTATYLRNIGSTHFPPTTILAIMFGNDFLSNDKAFMARLKKNVLEFHTKYPMTKAQAKDLIKRSSFSAREVQDVLEEVMSNPNEPRERTDFGDEKLLPHEVWRLLSTLDVEWRKELTKTVKRGDTKYFLDGSFDSPNLTIDGSHGCPPGTPYSKPNPSYMPELVKGPWVVVDQNTNLSNHGSGSGNPANANAYMIPVTALAEKWEHTCPLIPYMLHSFVLLKKHNTPKSLGYAFACFRDRLLLDRYRELMNGKRVTTDRTRKAVLVSFCKQVTNAEEMKENFGYYDWHGRKATLDERCKKEVRLLKRQRETEEIELGIIQKYSQDDEDDKNDVDIDYGCREQLGQNGGVWNEVMSHVFWFDHALAKFTLKDPSAAHHYTQTFDKFLLDNRALWTAPGITPNRGGHSGDWHHWSNNSYGHNSWNNNDNRWHNNNNNREHHANAAYNAAYAAYNANNNAHAIHNPAYSIDKATAALHHGHHAAALHHSHHALTRSASSPDTITNWGAAPAGATHAAGSPTHEWPADATVPPVPHGSSYVAASMAAAGQQVPFPSAARVVTPGPPPGISAPPGFQIIEIPVTEKEKLSIENSPVLPGTALPGTAPEDISSRSLNSPPVSLARAHSPTTLPSIQEVNALGQEHNLGQREQILNPANLGEHHQLDVRGDPHNMNHIDIRDIMEFPRDIPRDLPRDIHDLQQIEQWTKSQKSTGSSIASTHDGFHQIHSVSNVASNASNIPPGIRGTTSSDLMILNEDSSISDSSILAAANTLTRGSSLNVNEHLENLNPVYHGNLMNPVSVKEDAEARSHEGVPVQKTGQSQGQQTQQQQPDFASLQIGVADGKFGADMTSMTSNVTTATSTSLQNHGQIVVPVIMNRAAGHHNDKNINGYGTTPQDSTQKALLSKTSSAVPTSSEPGSNILDSNIQGNIQGAAVLNCTGAGIHGTGFGTEFPTSTLGFPHSATTNCGSHASSSGSGSLRQALEEIDPESFQHHIKSGAPGMISGLTTSTSTGGVISTGVTPIHSRANSRYNENANASIIMEAMANYYNSHPNTHPGATHPVAGGLPGGTHPGGTEGVATHPGGLGLPPFDTTAKVNAFVNHIAEQRLAFTKSEDLFPSMSVESKGSLNPPLNSVNPANAINPGINSTAPGVTPEINVVDINNVKSNLDINAVKSNLVSVASTDATPGMSPMTNSSGILSPRSPGGLGPGGATTNQINLNDAALSMMSSLNPQFTNKGQHPGHGIITPMYSPMDGTHMPHYSPTDDSAIYNLKELPTSALDEFPGSFMSCSHASDAPPGGGADDHDGKNSFRGEGSFKAAAEGSFKGEGSFKAAGEVGSAEVAPGADDTVQMGNVQEIQEAENCPKGPGDDVPGSFTECDSPGLVECQEG